MGNTEPGRLASVLSFPAVLDGTKFKTQSMRQGMAQPSFCPLFLGICRVHHYCMQSITKYSAGHRQPPLNPAPLHILSRVSYNEGSTASQPCCCDWDGFCPFYSGYRGLSLLAAGTTAVEVTNHFLPLRFQELCIQPYSKNCPSIFC